MRFHKNIPQEVRTFLQEQLKEYEVNTPMSKEERRELHEWVAKGRSPYDNGDYICGAGGYPLISSVLCEPKKNCKIGLTAYQKKKKRRKDGFAAIRMLPKQTSFILICPPFR